ncbi:hypothetical protein HispidOSU_006671 [Sigmodon hispidus]
MEEAPTKETSATPTMETLSLTESGISTGLSGAEGSSACCDPRPRLTWEGRLDLKNCFRQYRNPEEETFQGRDLDEKTFHVLANRFKMKVKDVKLWYFTKSFKAQAKEMLRHSREKRINRMMRERWQKYYSCNKCCQKSFPGPERSSQNTNPDSDLGEALKALKNLKLSTWYHQNPDDLWKDWEAFEKPQLSPGCQNTGDTSQDF